MKLLFCQLCGDTAALSFEWRYCRCGASRARYNAISKEDMDKRQDFIGHYEGPCIPFAIANPSMESAIECWLETGEGSPVLAFTISESDTGRITYNFHHKQAYLSPESQPPVVRKTTEAEQQRPGSERPRPFDS